VEARNAVVADQAKAPKEAADAKKRKATKTTAVKGAKRALTMRTVRDG
jgi:hypothetical protein